MIIDTDQVAYDMFHFLFNGTPPATTITLFSEYSPPSGLMRTKSDHEYTGAHSTSHNAELRMSLAEIIRQIDIEYYNGDITWLSSILPC